MSAFGRGTGRVVNGTGRRIRRATSAEGAGESGLAKLIELHAVNSFGDMLITIALASTIFFSVPTGEARGRVALYLLITMAPFALLAPVIGPLLDRLPHGRRAAMAVSMLARAVLAWTMAGVISGGGIALYPEALGVLVASKAYGVVRSVVVPRLLPHQVTLVKANSRVTLAGLIATGVAAVVGGLLHLLGPGWPLRGAFLVFVAGTLLAFALPPTVDSAQGEKRALLVKEDAAGPQEAITDQAAPVGEAASEREERLRERPLRSVGPSVLLALRAVAGLRGLSGFLTMFLAFLLRADSVGGLHPGVALGLVAVAAGIGNALGSVLGSWLRTRGPEATVTAMVALAVAATACGALWYGVLTVTLVAASAGIAQSLGKLALDALIQRDVPEEVRTSAFARSETLMQLCWVAGGGLGIVLPLNGVLGFGIAAGIMAVTLGFTVWSLFGRDRGGTPHPRAA
ncbi:MFS transporter [Peterkaempfera bronchialis]|uniref:MFS transporter n=1 Tax=Peterkaempfera bronchialis TaxID=2126346 RepID=A0A345SWS2_9ACTN|nr:MFS transporter [Peterkaempfera bronchialis]AXI78177.1 MFS transporter [Peterkaempfera bronchialis]